MTKSSPGGVYLEPGPSGWWGYVAVRLITGVGFADNPDYASLDASVRLRRMSQGTVTYLRRIAQADPGAVVELRWLAGAGQPVRSVLLGRVAGADPAAVVRRAGRLREALLALPTYVSGMPVDQEAEIPRLLRPFRGAYRVELRKRRLRLRPDSPRPDLPPDGIEVVVPFPAMADPARSFEALLATAPYPVIAGVALRPHQISPDDLAAATERFRWYQALAEDRTVRNLGLYGRSETRFAGVRLAAPAAELLRDAASRYGRGGFLVRIGLASAGPLPVGFDSQLADALVPTAGKPGPATALLAQLAGGGRRYLLRPPTTPEQVRLFDHNLTTLDVGRWAPMPVAWLEALATVVDAPEAATVFRLPLPAEPDLRTPATSADSPPGTVIIRDSGMLQVPIGYGVREGVRADPVSLDLTGVVAVLGGWRGDKRHSVRSLLRWLWVERRVPFLVIEPGAGEYRSLLAEPEFADLVVLTAGVEAVAPLRLNPLDLPSDWLVPVIQAAFPALPAVADALSAVRAEDSGNTLVEMARHSDDEALSRWYRQRVSGAAGTVFDTRTSLPVPLLAERPVVVELADLPRTDRTFAASLALARAAGIGVPHVTVVADAHRLFDDSAGPLLSRARQRGGLILVADPTEPASGLVGAADTVVLHRTGAGSRDGLGLPDTGTLPMGRVLVGAVNQPWRQVLLEPALSADAGTTDDAVADNAVRVRFEQAIEPWRRSLAPYRECAGCRFQCQLRAASLATVARAGSETFLTLLRGYPVSNPLAVGHWWRNLHEYLGAHGPATEPDRRADQLVCLLIHLHRTATGAPGSFWANRYRQLFGR